MDLPGFAATFGATGVNVALPGRNVHWGAAQVEGLESGSTPVLSRSADSVFIESGPIREQWERRSEGLEHSILISSPPRGVSEAGLDSGEVKVHMTLQGGLRARVDRGDVLLSDAEGRDLLAYRDLVVRDAGGQVLPGRLEAAGSTVTIRVRYLKATYPILIDPLLTCAAQKKSGQAPAGDLLERWRANGAYINLTSLRCCFTGSWTWKRVYVDVDRNAGTGYQVQGLGIDVLVENGAVYRYAGSGTDWAWSLASSINLQEGVLDGLNFASWLTEASSFTDAQGRFSGDKTMIFEIERPGAILTGLPYHYRHTGDHVGSPRSFFAENDGSRIFYFFQLGAGSPRIDFYQAFIDSDLNPSTGFPFREGVGADFLIENETLYRYSGSDGSWSWTPVADAHWSGPGNPFSLWSIDRAAVGLTHGTADVEKVVFAGFSSTAFEAAEDYIHEFSGVIGSAGAWTSLSSGTSNNLNGVFFTDTSNGWAVGANGTILRTSDGGASWSTQPCGTSNSLTRVQFVSNSRGWAVGADGTILATVDGGASWTRQSCGTSATLRGLSFVSASQGWAVGDGGTILRTVDGGATWVQQASGTDSSLGAVSFVHATRGFAGGDGGVILSTFDGGATWHRQTYVIPGSSSSPNLTDARFIGESRGTFAGYAFNGDTLLTTADGGGTWTLNSPADPPTALLGLAFGDANHFWGVGTGGYIVASEDGGFTWSIQSSPTGLNLHAVAFVSASAGWAVGANGTILKTTTGGR